MKISNRKLLLRRMSAIGLMVAVFGIPWKGYADESSDSPQSVARRSVNPLADKRIEQTDQWFLIQDQLRTNAQKHLADKNFKEAVEVYEELLASFGDMTGQLATDRKQLFESELLKVKNTWASDLIIRAKQAQIEEKFNDATALLTDARTIDPSQKDEIDSLLDLFQKQRRNLEVERDVSLETANPSGASDAAKIGLLLREAQVFYDNNRLHDARSRAEQVFLIDPFNANAIQLMNKIYRKLYSTASARHLSDTAGIVAHADWSWAEPVFSASLSQGPSESIQKQTSDQEVYARMEKIVFPTISFDDADIMAVVRFLNNRGKTFDPDKVGVNITTGMDSRTIEQLSRITMDFKQIPMSEVLRYICQDTGLKYRVDGDGIFIGTEVNEMQVRNFQIRGDLISSITEDAGAVTVDDEGGGEGGGGGGEGGGGPLTAANLGVSGEADTDFLGGNSGLKAKKITEAALKKYFGIRGVTFFEGASVSYDKRSGRLSVKNTPDNLRRLDELIRQLDAIEKPLVMVEIKALEISEVDLQELGFEWSMDAIGKTKSDGSGWSFGMGVSQSDSSNALSVIREGITEVNSTIVSNWNFFPSLFGNVHPFGSDNALNISLSINALSQNTRTETLSAPKVMTLNDMTATVKMVKSYYFPTDWDTYDIDDNNGNYTITAPVPDFDDDGTDIGIIFDVKPKVNADNYTITLELNPSFTAYLGRDEYPLEVKGEFRAYVNGSWTTTPTSDRFSVWMPMVSRRNVKVTVNVYDGETLVLGGMVDSTTEKRTDKWPILGDLPLVGRLFQSESEDISRNNLLIFVTTRLVGKDGVPIRPSRPVGAPDFNR